MTHQMSLLENAFDSFNESLRKYQVCTSGDKRAYKFIVLHLSHALELFFKYYVYQSHPLLIYKNPFSKNILKENTIGLWEATQFLKNEGKDISPDLLNDLEWLKKLRNNIEHYKFDMEPSKVRKIIGHLIRATIDFNKEYKIIDFNKGIDSDCIKTFETLADEYLAELSEAKMEALNKSEGREVHDCPDCDESKTVAIVDDKYYCFFCDDTVEIRDLHKSRMEALNKSEGKGVHDCPDCGESKTVAIVDDKYHCFFCESTVENIECCICEQKYPETECSVWNDDYPPNIDYICEWCEESIMSK